MSTNKIHSKGNVPFSWENEPGISKETPRDYHVDSEPDVAVKLPPPPCLPPENGRASLSSGFYDLQNIPLPPCAFQAPPLRSGSRRGLYKEQNDPFLKAYKECTKSKSGKKGKRNMSLFSCKSSCSVRDDSIVRISQLPISKSHRERASPMKFDD